MMVVKGPLRVGSHSTLHLDLTSILVLQWIMFMAKSSLLLGACMLQVMAGLTTTTASTVVQASTSSTSGATALTTDSSPPPPPLPPLPPRDIALYPPIPPPPTQGPSPFLPIIGIFILVLAFLGLASTIIALPFHLSPSTVPHPSSGGEGKSGTEAKVKVPSSTPTIRLGTWMTFFLVICVGLVMVQGRFGLGPGCWKRAGCPVGALNLVQEGQLPLVGVEVGVPVQAPRWGHDISAGRGAVAPVGPAQHVQPAQQRLDYVLRGKQQLVDAQALPFTNIRPQEVSSHPNGKRQRCSVALY